MELFSTPLEESEPTSVGKIMALNLYPACNPIGFHLVLVDSRVVDPEPLPSPLFLYLFYFTVLEIRNLSHIAHNICITSHIILFLHKHLGTNLIKD